MPEYTKPLPSVSGETKTFWDACRRGELLIQKCDACGQFQWYPRGICAHCWAQDIKWVVASGEGTIWTFTVTHQNRTAGFVDDVPYVVALVELEEGVRMFCNIVECNYAEVKIGMPVEVTFTRATNEISIPFFKPVAA